MAIFFDTEEPTDRELIRSLENKLGIQFPIEYVNHLLKYNGGRCEPNVFTFKENGIMSSSSIDWFLALYSGEYDNLEDYCDLYKLKKKRLPYTFFPIAHDAGGNLICMDSSDGKVYYWDHENEVDYESSEDSNRQNCHYISATVDEFLLNLSQN